ncbi:hypothetical protein HDU86_000117 [Geranomyces michiganensis]|nr:hypothetical protein HDU86_000117 [Geranomyces michiganensis]
MLKPHANGTRTLLTHLHFCVELYPDDAKDKVFLAIVKALLRGGNRPCTPKELSNLILKHKLTTLGGATPYATVSSRISQHFRRATDLNRSPLLGRRSLDNKKSRRLVYYVDQVGVPVNPGDDRPHSDSEDSAGEGGETSGPLVSSPIASPAVSDPPGSAKPLADGRGSSNDSGNVAADPTTPLRVSARVKRRKSPYSPSDEPHIQSKRSRSNSISQHADQSETDSRQPRRKSAEAWPSPSRGSGPSTFELSNDESDDDMSLRRRNQAPQHTTASSHTSLPHHQPLTMPPQSPEFAFRPRSTSDDIVLHPITSPQMHITAAATLPSQLSPSQPALDFEVAKEFLPSPFLDPGIGLLEAESCYTAEVLPSSSYRMDPALSTFAAAGLGVSHHFHHPENVSVSELDFLLGDGGDDGWGISSTTLPLSKRVMHSEPEIVERDSKRRKIDGVSHESQSTSESEEPFQDATGLASAHSSVSTPSAALVIATVQTEPQSAAGLDQANRLGTPPPTATEQIRVHSNVASSPSSSDSTPHETLSHELSPVSVSSYRCNGDTLEVYEKVARYSIAVRASKIKSAPRLDLLHRVQSLDASGRLVSQHTKSSDVRVGVYMEGFVRARELFDYGGKKAPSESHTDAENPVKAEDGEPRAADDKLVWAAYVDELRKRTLGSRNGNESLALKICGTGNESDAGFVLVELKGSDIEGDVGVPVQCGGVWIPTPEARRLADALGVSDRLTDLFSSGSDSTSDFETLPSVSTLTSSKFQSLLSAPNRPSTLSLPIPKSLPAIKIGDKSSEASLATAGLDEEVRHDDFLDFDAHAEWSQEESGAGESGDEAKGPLNSLRTENIPLSQPPVSLDPSTLHLVPPIQPINGGGPIYMTNIDGVLCYVMWLVKGADGNFVGTPAKEVPNPMEKALTLAQGASVAGPTSTSGPSASSTSAAASVVATSVSKSESHPPVPLLRRVDNNMVNATLLLHAGGLVTDKERSIVLSLERGRARCRKKGSGLYGTWIPLNRARHLARTFCLQSKLGGFLGEGVTKAAFGITEGTVPTTPAAEQVIGSDGTVIYKAAETSKLAGSASAVAANKAALLGLTSLPPNVATGLASINNDPNSVRGLLASARGRGRGRLPSTPLVNAPVSGRSLIGGRVGTGIYTPSTNTTPSPAVTSAPSVPPVGLAGMSNSAALAATQAAIAALTKLGGSGPLTAATLATALAALNQVAPGGKPGTGPAPVPPVGAASIPSPASILQAFATVFKNGFPTNWKPTPTVSSANPSASTTYTPSATTTAVNQQSGAKPFSLPVTSLAATPSSTPGPPSAPAIPTIQQPNATPGVVARALAAASVGRGAGLNKAGISSPVSLQTHALYGLPLPSTANNISTASLTAPATAASSSSSTASIPLIPPPSSPSPTVNQMSSLPIPPGIGAAVPVSQSVTTAPNAGVPGGNAVPLVPNVPIIPLHDIDGPIAGSTTVAAASTQVSPTLPRGYAENSRVPDLNLLGSSGPVGAHLPTGMALTSVGVIQAPVSVGGVPGYLDDEEVDDLDDIEAIKEDSEDDEEDYEGEDYDEDDADDAFASADSTSPPAGNGGKFVPAAPNVGGGKIKPSASVPATGVTTPAKGRAKGRGKPTTKRQPAKQRKAAGSGAQNAGAATVGTPKSRPTAKSKKGPAAAAVAASFPSSKGKGKGKGKGTATAVAGVEDEGSDFEIDVCDGDGVDDFR